MELKVKLQNLENRSELIELIPKIQMTIEKMEKNMERVQKQLVNTVSQFSD